MSSVILQLVEKGAIVECVPMKGQFLSNIFLEPKPNKSFRLILNLKELNKFVQLEHFKIEDYKVAIKLIAASWLLLISKTLIISFRFMNHIESF